MERWLSRRATVGWAVWVSLLLATPYTMGERVVCGCSSYASLYAVVALGLLAGMGALMLPDVARFAATHARAIVAGTPLALVCSLIVFVGEWTNVALGNVGMALYKGNWMFLDAEGPEGVVQVLSRAVCSVYAGVDAGLPALLFAGSLGCGFVGGLMFGGREGLLGFPLPSRSPTLPVALCLCLGLVRAPAWAVLLPHSPLSATAGVPAAFSSDPWQATGPLSLVPLCSVALMLAVCWRLGAGPSMGTAGGLDALGRSCLRCLSAFCIGELCWYACACAVPGMERLLGAAGPLLSLVLYGALLLGLVVLDVARGRSGAAERDVRGHSSEWGAPSAVPLLDARAEAALSEHRLTNREKDAVRAWYCGMAVQEAAEKLNLRPSTFYEYRRRACRKLGVRSLGELPMVWGRGADGSRGADERDQMRDRACRTWPMRIACGACLVVWLSMLGSPAPMPLVRSLLCGMAFGLVFACLPQRRVGVSPSLKVARAAVTVCCCAVVQVVRCPVGDWLDLDMGGAAPLLTMVLSTCAACASMRLCGLGVENGADDVRADVLLAAVAFALGMLGYRLALADESFSPIPVYSLALLDIVLLHHGTRRGGNRAAHVASAAVAVAVSALYSVGTGLVVLTVAELALLVGSPEDGARRPRARVPVSSLPAWALCVSLLVLVPMGLAILFAGQFLGCYRHEAVCALRLYGCVVATLVCVALARTLHGGEVPLGIGSDAMRRLQGFLVGKGLNDSQSRVLAGVLQGQSTREIADAMGYSRSWVSAVRWTAYGALGVSSSDGLRRLVPQDLLEHV